MGDKDAHTAAAAYLEHIRQTMKYEKSKARNVKKGTARKRSKSAGHSRTISEATGIDVNPRKRSKVTRNKIGTWSHAQGRLHQANSSADEYVNSTLVLENPRAHEHSTSLEFLTFASQPDQVYQYLYLFLFHLVNHAVLVFNCYVAEDLHISFILHHRSRKLFEVSTQT